MRNALSTYLNDHLAGATIARQLLDVMQKQNEDEHFRLFAKDLLPQIEEDDRTLRSIIDKITPRRARSNRQADGFLRGERVRSWVMHAQRHSSCSSPWNYCSSVFREKCFSGKYCVTLQQETTGFAPTTLRNSFGGH
jgi:hypothetical protein